MQHEDAALWRGPTWAAKKSVRMPLLTQKHLQELRWDRSHRLGPTKRAVLPTLLDDAASAHESWPSRPATARPGWVCQRNSVTRDVLAGCGRGRAEASPRAHPCRRQGQSTQGRSALEGRDPRPLLPPRSLHFLAKTARGPPPQSRPRPILSIVLFAPLALLLNPLSQLSAPHGPRVQQASRLLSASNAAPLVPCRFERHQPALSPPVAVKRHVDATPELHP
mmetsp:Transcript_51971/g.138539  ORF Transcript_51971/g.138539 Transcript_51971/m.138539 type:complete len:222 (-) Transcript_51971:3556-4221(-)